MHGTPTTSRATARTDRFSKLRALSSILATGTVVCVLFSASASAGASTSPKTPSQRPMQTSHGVSSSAALPSADQSYWLAAADGGVYAFGGAAHYGTMAGRLLDEPVVGMAATPTGDGYWLVARDGRIFSFGSAKFYGSMGGEHLAFPVVGMVGDPATGGYWLVAADGGVFSFHAPFFGSLPGIVRDSTIAQQVVGMAATPTGRGYWLVASDGRIFSFGSAHSYGSLDDEHLDEPVVGMSATTTGHGYWLVTSDGRIFSFGAAAGKFRGSFGGHVLSDPIVGMTAMFDDDGYWMTDAEGQVTAFGTAQRFGSAAPVPPSTIVGIAVAKGTGSSTSVGPSTLTKPVLTAPASTPPSVPTSTASSSTTYPPAARGYDISIYQCGGLPGGAHTIGIVEVNDSGDMNPNACFSTEVSWAGPGLNLYMFMIYGRSATAEPGCASAPVRTACDYGYIEAISNYDWAISEVGSRATVPWWLDVEGANWSKNIRANSSVLMGAIDALHAAGVASVGFYANFTWGTLMGAYDPEGPLIVPWWQGPPPAYKCTHYRAHAASTDAFVPSGRIEIVQYTSGTFDDDYACS